MPVCRWRGGGGRGEIAERTDAQTTTFRLLSTDMKSVSPGLSLSPIHPQVLNLCVDVLAEELEAASQREGQSREAEEEEEKELTLLKVRGTGSGHMHAGVSVVQRIGQDGPGEGAEKRVVSWATGSGRRRCLAAPVLRPPTCMYLRTHVLRTPTFPSGRSTGRGAAGRPGGRGGGLDASHDWPAQGRGSLWTGTCMVEAGVGWSDGPTRLSAGSGGEDEVRARSTGGQ